MVRIILGIAAGIVAAFATIAGIEYLGHLLFPHALPTDWNDKAAVAAWAASTPLGADLTVVAAWLIGTMVGAWGAGRVARRAPVGWIPAALVLVAGIANLVLIPHPLWMTLAAVAAPIAGGWIGVRLAREPGGRATPS